MNIIQAVFRETAPRNTAENTVNYRGDSVGSVVVIHSCGRGNLVTVTTLSSVKNTYTFIKVPYSVPFHFWRFVGLVRVSNRVRVSVSFVIFACGSHPGGSNFFITCIF